MRLRHLLLLLPALLAVTPRAMSVTVTEDFSTNPGSRWKIFGNTNLFRWNSTNQNLAVTWDSSKTNSYFHLSLGTIVAREDDFSVSFDMTLQDVASGTTPGKPYDMQLALGFLNYTNATNVNFSRGSGFNSTYGAKNLVEFDYFPPFDIYDATISQSIIATNNSTWLYNDKLLPMTIGDLFHVTMSYSGATRKLTTSVNKNGTAYGSPQVISVMGNADFRCDTFSITSYSDQNSTGSVLAHGTIDNVIVTFPAPPMQNLRGYFTNGQWRAEFTGATNWTYVLEKSSGLLNAASWSEVSQKTNGTGAKIILPGTNTVTEPVGFYRVRANRL
jgi:hypothetical protein